VWERAAITEALLLAKLAPVAPLAEPGSA
jgi:hypothetical protein